jgi:hypothetical protein
MNHAAFFSRQMCGNHQTFKKTTTFKEEGLIGGEKSLIDRERESIFGMEGSLRMEI